MSRLQTGFRYKAKYVSHPQEKFTAFQTGVKNKTSGEWVNYRFFLMEYIEIEDGQEFKLDEIVSIEQKEFNGKQQFNVTAKITVGGFADGTHGGSVDAPSVNITSDDLPF